MILKFLYNLLEGLTISINKLITFLNREYLSMSAPFYDVKGRYLLYYANNLKLLDNYRILKIIFHKLQQDEVFRKFGSKKIIYINCFIDGNRYSFHRNVLITNNMTFTEYWSKIVEDLKRHSENSDYWLSEFSRFEIRIWNLDLKNNFNIKGGVLPGSVAFNKNMSGELSSNIIPIVKNNSMKASGFQLGSPSALKASGFLLGSTSSLKATGFLLGSTSYLSTKITNTIRKSGFHSFIMGVSYEYNRSGFLLGSIIKEGLSFSKGYKPDLHLPLNLHLRLYLRHRVVRCFHTDDKKGYFITPPGTGLKVSLL
jgi:hypothetical protein